jgi:hypothetical protein
MWLLLYNMPFAIKKFGSGFKVCNKKRCFSNAPLSYDNAVKQRVAIALSEHKKNPKKPISYYFK